jgi:hypothetical protein
MGLRHVELNLIRDRAVVAADGRGLAYRQGLAGEVDVGVWWGEADEGTVYVIGIFCVVAGAGGGGDA